MYDPKGNGKDKRQPDVRFVETEPPAHLQGIVHRFLEVETTGTLPEDYRFHALPDACTYVVFDRRDPRITGISQLRAVSEEFNLGRSFQFTNIRLLPGAWQGGAARVVKGLIDAPYEGDLPLVETSHALFSADSSDRLAILTGLVDNLVAARLVARNPITERILHHIDEIQSVADMANISNLSPRQLQRRLKATTGFAPHDFLKVIRLQQSLDGTNSWSYADQSHFIHSFRRATGYTPGKYARKFDV